MMFLLFGIFLIIEALGSFALDSRPLWPLWAIEGQRPSWIFAEAAAS